MDTRETRVGVSMTATMSDGNFVFEGQVENISRTGFKMTDIPAKFDPESSECTAVITNQDKSYKFAIRPSWSTEDGIYHIVGFEILSPPAEWIELLDELDPLGLDPRKPRHSLAEALSLAFVGCCGSGFVDTGVHNAGGNLAGAEH